MVLKVLPSDTLNEKEYEEFKREFHDNSDNYVTKLARHGITKYALEDEDIYIILGNSNTEYTSDEGNKSLLDKKLYTYRKGFTFDGNDKKKRNAATEIVINYGTEFIQAFPISLSLAFGDILAEQYGSIICKNPINEEFYLLQSGFAIFTATKMLSQVDITKAMEMVSRASSFYEAVLLVLNRILMIRSDEALDKLIPDLVDLSSGFAAIHGKVELNDEDKSTLAILASVFNFQNACVNFYNKLLYNKNVEISEYNGMLMQLKIMHNTLYRKSILSVKGLTS